MLRLAPGASGASSRRVSGRRFLVAPAAAQRLALLAVRGRGLSLGSVTDTVLVLLHGCARPFGPVLGGAPGGLGDAFPQSSWLLRPWPYLQLFPGSRSRSRLLGLMRVSQGCPARLGQVNSAVAVAGAQAGSLLPFPLPARGAGLLGGFLGTRGAARPGGSLGARGAARPGDTARPLSSNSGGGRGVTWGTRPRAGRAAPVTRPAATPLSRGALKPFCITVHRTCGVGVRKVVEAGLYGVLSNLL